MNENRVEGVDDVLKNLNRVVQEIELRSVGGLLACAAMIIGEAQELVPVEFGDLMRSAYFRRSPTREKTVEFGFSQNYALYVHENMDAYHHVGEAKYLANAIFYMELDCIELLEKLASGALK